MLTLVENPVSVSTHEGGSPMQTQLCSGQTVPWESSGKRLCTLTEMVLLAWAGSIFSKATSCFSLVKNKKYCLKTLTVETCHNPTATRGNNFHGQALPFIRNRIFLVLREKRLRGWRLTGCSAQCTTTSLRFFKVNTRTVSCAVGEIVLSRS